MSSIPNGLGASERKCAHRRAFRIAIVDLTVAPGENGVAIREIREVAAVLVIPPRVFAPVQAPRRVLPLGFSREPISFPLPSGQRLAVFDCLQAVDVDDRMTIASAGRALAALGGIEPARDSALVTR